MNDPINTLDEIVSVAKLAGQKIMAVYESDEFNITQKSDNTPLTKADVAAHDVIIKGLSELEIQYPILSEESVKIPFTERSSWQTYWLVDPLDGTREFIKRNGEFTVNIALVSDHCPLLGVIYTPVKDVCYYACKSHGAFKQIGNQAPIRLHAKKKLTNCPTIAGSRSHQDDSLQRFLSNIGEHEIFAMGSSLKSCLVAEGEVDIYPRLGPTSEWDTGAAQCIVEEAGGAIIGTNGKALLYNTKDSLLNPDFLVVGDPSYNWIQYL